MRIAAGFRGHYHCKNGGLRVHGARGLLSKVHVQGYSISSSKRSPLKPECPAAVAQGNHSQVEHWGLWACVLSRKGLSFWHLQEILSVDAPFAPVQGPYVSSTQTFCLRQKLCFKLEAKELKRVSVRVSCKKIPCSGVVTKFSFESDRC